MKVLNLHAQRTFDTRMRAMYSRMEELEEAVYCEEEWDISWHINNIDVMIYHLRKMRRELTSLQKEDFIR